MARLDRTLSARELHERLCSEGAEDDRADQEAAAAERLGDHYDRLADWHPWVNTPATADGERRRTQPDRSHHVRGGRPHHAHHRTPDHGCVVKFSTSAKDLLDALTTASRVASARSAIQALGGVQITATKKEGVRIRATDMDIGLSLPLDAAVATEGTVVLPARLLLDVAKSMSGMDASLELRPVEQDVEVLSGSASFHIRTLRAEDFPPLPEPAADNAVNVPAAAFVDTINRVARAASRDETAPS